MRIWQREREEGCLHRMHLLIITYITSNDVWKALSGPAFHYAQDSITQLRFHIWRVNWSKHNAQIALLISQLWVVLKVQLPPHSVPWLETDAFADLEVIHRVATQMPSCHLRLYQAWVNSFACTHLSAHCSAGILLWALLHAKWVFKNTNNLKRLHVIFCKCQNEFPFFIQYNTAMFWCLHVPAVFQTIVCSVLFFI